jgi:hypothetical protein
LALNYSSRYAAFFCFFCLIFGFFYDIISNYIFICLNGAFFMKKFSFPLIIFPILFLLSGCEDFGAGEWIDSRVDSGVARVQEGIQSTIIMIAVIIVLIIGFIVAAVLVSKIMKYKHERDMRDRRSSENPPQNIQTPSYSPPTKGDSPVAPPAVPVAPVAPVTPVAPVASAVPAVSVAPSVPFTPPPAAPAYVPPAVGSAALPHGIRGEKGQFSGKEFPVDRRLVFGRNPKVANIIFGANVQGVSSAHCEIKKTPSGLFLTDIGSSHGTFLNGVRLTPGTPSPLKVGDCFFLGTADNMFMIT